MKCYVIKWITYFILFSLTVLICLKNGEFVIFVFWNVRLKLQYLKCSRYDFYENLHVFPRNLVSTHSSVFLNLKVYLSRKYKNKSVGVRKVVRCSRVIKKHVFGFLARGVKFGIEEVEGLFCL